MSKKDPMGELRVAIDQVDDELMALLERRASLAAQVAATKKKSGSGYYVPSREREIIERLERTAATGTFPARAVRPVFQEVISACLSVQKLVKVAYLGPEATFTHQAVRHHFGTSAEAIPCGSIAAVFEEVAKGEANFAVVPVENSTEGVVNHTLDSFFDSDLTIIAEVSMPIELVLLARTVQDPSGVSRLYSHAQPFAQCRGWIQANLPRAVQIECASTAEAAQRARGDSTSAAIGAELAARVYGLNVVRRALQDAQDNATRFFVVSADPIAPARAGIDYKTSVVLVLPDQAGALYDVLRPLSDANINLTKIESRPSRRRAWEYVFFLDLDGHRDDASIQPVLSTLADRCDVFKVLGSYQKASKQ